MKAAERTGEPGTMLLLHEFFEVNVRVSGQGTQSQIYQALEFAVEEDGTMAVRGQYYATANIIRGHRPAPARTHTYDAENAWEDADLALRDDAPELVKVVNCTAWFPMARLTDGKPRVVHPAEIKERGIHIAGKEQHWVCGTAATELGHVEGLQEAGFHTWPIPRGDVVSRPEDVLGDHWVSVTSEWDNVEAVFRGIRDVLRSGSGMRSGSFDMQFSMATFLFWNQVTDTATGDWRRSAQQVLERRFDAAFNFQQVHRDTTRLEITCRTKRDFNRLQWASGLFGMVAVAKETEQGQEAIHRFETGTQLRVCASGASLADAEDGMLADEHWASRGGTYGSVKMRFDKAKGIPLGTLKVSCVWHEVTFNDVPGFEDQYLAL